jgi:adenosylmethionine-8-amino-7-oxononanoate aminotransferase
LSSHVFHRSFATRPLTAVSARGSFIFDDQGKRYLDASGGAAVSCLGHCHPKVTDAVREQLGRLDYAHTGFFTNTAQEALADDIIAHAPANMARVFVVSGGSEAVESAIKMARQYWLEKGEVNRTRIIARRQSYHGNTLGALAVGGNMARRAPYAPLLTDAASHIAPCYAYRDRRDDEDEEAYGERVADELEAEILRLGSCNVAAFVAEPVVGATLGSVPAVPGYFRRIREICDRYGVLIIADEVMSGMGRCGTLYAMEHEGVEADIIVMAKGLGGGFQPIGCVVASHRVVQAFIDGSGAFTHGHTYMGHPVACAAGLAVQRVLREESLIDRVRENGPRLEAMLQDRFGNHPHVGDIRGRGYFWSLEFVQDRASKAVFDPALKLNVRVGREALDRGLVCYPMGGTIDGVRGDHVSLAPPYNASDEELAMAVDLLGDTVEAAIVSTR